MSKPTPYDMLVHICCSVDSHYFLSELQKIYPNSKMLGYFYNPNIHPKEEYDLRLLDVERSCKMLGVDLIEGEYEIHKWFDDVRGLECEPEKGKRCEKCFDMRLEKSAQVAQKMSIHSFTSTLLASPLKEQEILYAEGDEIACAYGLDFVKINVRSNGGTQAQSVLANKDRLYKQTYCGCQFALNKQREKQNQFPLELMSNIGRQIAPGSNEERQLVFAMRDKCECEGVEYILYKHPKMIWRNLRSLCIKNSEVIGSYVLTHSRSKNMVKTSNITYIKQSIHIAPFLLQANVLGERLESAKSEVGGSADVQNVLHKSVSIWLGYARHDDSVFISVEDINALLGTSYHCAQDMVYCPPLYKDELMLRTMLCGADSLNPIIILDSRIEDSMKVFINAHFQESNVFGIITH